MMEAAVAEVVRVGVWALRGLGMQFGIAERAAPTLAWTEAVEGGALKVLRENAPLLNAPRPTDWYSKISDTEWKLDARSRSLLEVGPVAVDLLTLAARTRKVGRVDIVNACDPIFLSGVARIATKRKIGIIAMSAGLRLTLCGVPVVTLHACPGRYDSSFDESDNTQNNALNLAVIACREQLTQIRDKGSVISILSYALDEAPAPIGNSLPRFDAEGKYAFAQAHGMRVEREDLEHLYQLEVRTWAPTSERSRGQALA